MSETASVTAGWRLDGESSELRLDDLRGRLSEKHPDQGLRQFSRAGKLLTESLFAALTPDGSLAAPSECYVRGADHVSTHPATDDYPFRTQLAWTAEDLGAGASAVILSVSLQTSLLETRPELLFETLGEGRALTEACTLGWLLGRGEGPTVVLLPHPTDAPESELVSGEGSAGIKLSPPFLEKGVIRRCRLAAITFPGLVDDAAITAAIDAFADLPTPLAT